MFMSFNGLVKLTEECGEAIQVAAKMIAYPHLMFGSTPHPDGTVLRARLIEEIGDVLGIIQFVTEKLQLDPLSIQARKLYKLNRFREWDDEESKYESPKHAITAVSPIVDELNLGLPDDN